ncbi:MAG TPA: rhomboid family intramembrane serine protease [Nocardioides sp.]|uniref:rhomboid family intramembrane serine protease n=1 Tax=Nocardioides sp. TaxID=35761 RepID=UPI002C457295|nr:rhomboid family intramembrane serine protease [Nocardioides sp.]HQR26799.1 rhomboid family intramembrane serine protease [Nocardioides sp.]
MTQPPVPGTGVPTCYRHPGRETYIICQRCERPICPDCMRDAAVGFQCPSCVSDGARATRSGRTAYGGQRPANAATTSLVLIAINAAVWLLVLATGGGSSSWVLRLALSPLGRCVAGDYYFPGATATACGAAGHQWYPGVADGAWWQLITSAFTHVQVWHIAFNMIALWFLGPQLELAIGRARFLALYLGSALTASAVVYWGASPHSMTLGASGAIFGLMGALLVVALKVGGNVQQILFWIGLNFVITVAGSSFISWQGHLGGFLGGAAIAGILVYAPRERRTAWQAAGISGLLLVTLVAIAVRTLVLS